ncbi:hypothetical protein HON52_00445 [Candidatus Uhrbacteria bacterium]|jgi:hypothetical protein|nr:hypothetical protein [Candidatus Uhrbacteria bacterium]
MKKYITALIALMLLIVPLASAMARPSNVADQHPQGANVRDVQQKHGYCWVGDVPVGFNDQTLVIEITSRKRTNSEAQKDVRPMLPLMLTVEGSKVKVMRRHTLNEEHTPHGYLVTIGNVEYLETVLWPGQSCQVTPRQTPDNRYTVTTTRVSTGILSDNWLRADGVSGFMGYKNIVGGKLLHSGCEEKEVRYVGKTMPVVTKASDDFTDC